MIPWQPLMSVAAQAYLDEVTESSVKLSLLSGIWGAVCKKWSSEDG
jgi:hypothetical protein